MKINKNIFLALFTTFMVVAGCDEQFDAGEFDVDASLMPAAITDVPLVPSAILASYDEYCDKVEVNWMPSVRTSGYDLYRDGLLIAQDLSDTLYVDSEASTVDAEYAVYSKNPNGNSETAATAIGRMAATPPTPINFEATDGEYESKVDLSWDAADFAKYYIVKRGNVVLNDSVVGTGYSDEVDAPTDATEYSVQGVSVCGESAFATTTGYCDPLVAFSKPLDINFDSSPEGTSLADLGLGSNFGWLGTHTGETMVKVYVEGENANGGTKYGYLRQTGDGLGVALQLPEISLLEGQRYELSFDVKADVGVSLNMRETSSPKETYWTYLVPCNEKSGKANNLRGTGMINLGTPGEWTTITQDFPYTTSQPLIDQGSDSSSNPKLNDNLDTGRDNKALWIPTTITASQMSPYIEISLYNGPAAQAGMSIDNIKIVMLK